MVVDGCGWVAGGGGQVWMGADGRERPWMGVGGRGWVRAAVGGCGWVWTGEDGSLVLADGCG